MTSATSSGVIAAGAPPLASAHIFVSTDPGLTLFTRTPYCFTSTASASVISITAAFDAQYDTQPGNFSGPGTPEIEATLTIAPLRFAIIDGSARRDARYVPRTFTANMRSQSSGVTSDKIFGSIIPALLMRMSQSPNRDSVSANSRSIAEGSLTSPSIASMRGSTPADVAVRANAATIAPRDSSISAVARPIPDEAPVTIATRPSNSCGDI